MTQPKKTVLYDAHLKAGAGITDFAGYLMPIQYPDGIIAEHLHTRRYASLFDVSHMGRFSLRDTAAKGFLRHVLTNNPDNLQPGQSQYTIIADSSGFAVDDAWLYRPDTDSYLLVVNASNRQKDWLHLTQIIDNFRHARLEDLSQSLAMIALQGPLSEDILAPLVEKGTLPPPVRNSLSTVSILGMEVIAARTGYTGEPVCFELIMPSDGAAAIWSALLNAGAKPAGLGARDTLRLEAGLPLYGHEFGTDPEGKQIPVFACPLAKFAVNLDDPSRTFIGQNPLTAQLDARRRYAKNDYSDTACLPKLICQIAILDQALCRAGAKVFNNGRHIGFITSGTSVPYWKFDTDRPSDRPDRRSIAIALLDCRIKTDAKIQIELRGRLIDAIVVSRNLDNSSGRYALPLIYTK